MEKIARYTPMARLKMTTGSGGLVDVPAYKTGVFYLCADVDAVLEAQEKRIAELEAKLGVPPADPGAAEPAADEPAGGKKAKEKKDKAR